MEIPKHQLTDQQETFFNGIRIATGKTIYFYGSIQRTDYMPGKSDIDIDIFTENENSTIYALCNYLKKTKWDFQKTLYKVNGNIVNGYKTMYKDEDRGIKTEISIYNEKYKSVMLKEHTNGFYMPFYISILIGILKWLHYDLEILPQKQYSRCKRFLMNENDEQKFISYSQ